MTLQEFFLKQKKAIRNRSEEVFRLLRPEETGWRSAKDALSIAEMLRHLWVSEEGVRRVALDSNFAYYEARMPGGLAAVLGTPGSLDQELSNLDRVHRETLKAVAAQPGSLFEEERANAALGFRRTVAVILFGINEREILHRALLMMCLRMLGRPAPQPFVWPPKQPENR